MDEKRQLERIPLIYYLGVFDRNTDDLIGYLADITSEGALIMCEKPIKTGSSHELKIESYSLTQASKDIEFDARCMWTAECTTLNFYNCGVQFQRIEQEILEEIKVLVDKFGLEV